MSDLNIRELERAAQLGDESARMRLLGERLRLTGGSERVGELESRLRMLLTRAFYGVEPRHRGGAGLATLDDVAGVVLKGLSAPAITSGLFWRSGWTWKGARQGRVLIVAVKAGGPRMGEIAIGVGVTIDTRSENGLAVKNIWPMLGGGFPLEKDTPVERELREGHAVLWATKVRVGHGKTAVRVPVPVAEWWARERLGRWSMSPGMKATMESACPKCGAKPGERCDLPQVLGVSVHGQRYKAARGGLDDAAAKIDAMPKRPKP